MNRSISKVIASMIWVLLILVCQLEEGYGVPAPSSTPGDTYFLIKDCPAVCAYKRGFNYRKGVLICRKGISYCVAPSGYSKKGDICGCCKDLVPAPVPVPIPVPAPVPVPVPVPAPAPLKIVVGPVPLVPVDLAPFPFAPIPLPKPFLIPPFF